MSRSADREITLVLAKNGVRASKVKKKKVAKKKLPAKRRASKIVSIFISPKKLARKRGSGEISYRLRITGIFLATFLGMVFSAGFSAFLMFLREVITLKEIAFQQYYWLLEGNPNGWPDADVVRVVSERRVHKRKRKK